MTRIKISLAAAIIAHIFAWAATLFFLFWPIYGGVSVSPGESGMSRVSGKTLLEVNGTWAAFLIILPIIFTAIGLIASLPGTTSPRLMLTLRWAAFALMLLFCVVGIYSLGIFYLPAALAVLVAAVIRPSNR